MRARLCLLLAAVVVLAGLAAPGGAAAPRPSLAALSDVRGVVYANVNRPPALLLPDIQRLQAIGVNHVTLYVYLFVDGPTDNSAARGPTTPSDTELGLAIDAVHAAGMTVAVSPLPWWSGGNGPKAWRGLFRPTNPDAFFDSWRFWINHYAKLSQQHGVELYSIGSEQNSLQSHTAQWRRTAAEARRHYTGPLTYLATLNGSFPTIKFWDALDVVSVSPYISVSSQANPTYSEIRGTWQGYVMDWLRQVSRQTGKKVLIFETGFVNAQYFGRSPQDHQPSLVPAPQAQAGAYAAVLDAISATRDRRRFLLGIAWWDWDPQSVSAANATFSPRGKPAECVLAQRWSSGSVRSLAGLLPCASTR